MSMIQFEVERSGDLEKAFEQAVRKLPATTEKILKKEGKGIAGDLGTRVAEEARGHHHRAKNNADYENEQIEKNALRDSFSVGKVIRHGNNMTVAVLTKAPHYHLYDKVVNGKRKVGTRRMTGKRAVARKTVARYMAQRSEHSELIGQAVLDEVLKESGLL